MRFSVLVTTVLCSFICVLACIVSVNMNEFTRPLTVRFSSRGFSRLEHEEVLESLEEHIDPSSVRAIQITENTCFVTLNAKETKERLLLEGVNIRHTYNDIFDADRVITNVTIKDAPYELADSFLIHHMKSFGEVIEHSLRRGKVRGTEIETGTRYIQMVNVRNNLPIKAKFGRFNIRIYSDNKTECRICSNVGHPFYRCPDKEKPKTLLCSRCKCEGHLFRDCQNDIVCNFCSESGHKQSDCEKYKSSQLYGDYAYEIAEGQAANLEASVGGTSYVADFNEPDTHVQRNLDPDLVNEAEKSNGDTTNVNTTDTNDVSEIPVTPRETTFDRLSKERVFLVIGDSNSQRIHFKDPDIKNISVSGGSALNIDELLSKAVTEAGDKKVKRIVVHLGTNDITRYKADANQVILEITTAINKIHGKFPSSEIAFSSIPHRRGKSSATVGLNNTIKVVNEFFWKMAKKEQFLCFLNNDDELLKEGIPVPSMYDSSDSRGVHVSTKGAAVLEDNMQSFFDSGEASELDFDVETPSGRKRNRSVMSNTPPSAKQSDKTKKLTST